MSVQAASRSLADVALAAAFAEVRLIHDLMSFHLDDSDVSRINRAPPDEPIAVNRRSVEVLRLAGELSHHSDGHFDITVAPNLVAAGYLPAPKSERAPDAGARWQDIVVLSDEAVMLEKSAWIDLGGIAKGYAVDRALEACLAEGAPACIVDAGGDLRVSDGMSAAVRLAAPRADDARVPLLELSGGSVASSHGEPGAAVTGGGGAGPHFDGVTGAGVDPRHFVSVLCERCIIADALTKVVMTLAADASPVLSAFHATAFIHTPESGWRELP